MNGLVSSYSHQYVVSLSADVVVWVAVGLTVKDTRQRGSCASLQFLRALQSVCLHPLLVFPR